VAYSALFAHSFNIVEVEVEIFGFHVVQEATNARMAESGVDLFEGQFRCCSSTDARGGISHRDGSSARKGVGRGVFEAWAIFDIKNEVGEVHSPSLNFHILCLTCIVFVEEVADPLLVRDERERSNKEKVPPFTQRLDYGASLFFDGRIIFLRQRKFPREKRDGPAILI
jgi:hypothetical protein